MQYQEIYLFIFATWYLSSQPGIKSMPPALGAQSLTRGIDKEVPQEIFLSARSSWWLSIIQERRYIDNPVLLGLFVSTISSVQFSSVAQPCLTLCDPVMQYALLIN